MRQAISEQTAQLGLMGARRLAGLEIWPVAVATAVAVIAERALLPALGVAACFWVVRRVACGVPSVRTPVDGAILLLIAMIPVTLSVTLWPGLTHPQVYRLLVGVAFYYAIVNWTTTSPRVDLLTTGVIFITLVLATAALFSVDWGLIGLPWFLPETLYANVARLINDSVNPNVMAGQLVLLLPVALAHMLVAHRQPSWLRRLLVVSTVLVAGSVIILTQSLGALLALGMEVLTVLIFGLHWYFMRKMTSIQRLILSAVAIVVLLTLSVRAIVALSGYPASLVSPAFVSQKLELRLEIWERGLYLIQDFPLTGIGMGTFGPAVAHLYPFVLVRPEEAPHAHNVLIQVALDLGIPGLVAWLAIWGSMTGVAFQLYRHGWSQRDAWISALGAGLLSSQVALITHGLLDAVTWGMVRPAPIVWGMWGLTMASWRVYLRGSLHSASDTDRSTARQTTGSHHTTPMAQQER